MSVRTQKLAAARQKIAPKEQAAAAVVSEVKALDKVRSPIGEIAEDVARVIEPDLTRFAPI